MEKNKMIIVIIMVALIVGGFIYFSQQKINKLNIEQQSQEQYEKWKEQKIAQDIEEIGIELEKKWLNEDVAVYDSLYYQGVGESRDYQQRDGSFFNALSFFTQENRDNQLRSYIESEKDEQQKKLMEKLGYEHRDWLANDIYHIVKGKIFEEMTKEMVKIAWGEPDIIISKTKYEIWWYWINEIERAKDRDLLVFHKNGKLLFVHRDLSSLKQ